MNFSAVKARLTGRGMSEGMTQAMINMMVAKNEGLDNAEPRPPEVHHPHQLVAVVRRGVEARGSQLVER